MTGAHRGLAWPFQWQICSLVQNLQWHFEAVPTLIDSAESGGSTPYVGYLGSQRSRMVQYVMPHFQSRVAAGLSRPAPQHIQYIMSKR